MARIAAATLDLAIFIFVALILFSIGGFAVSQEGQTYANYVALVDDHIHYAQLAIKMTPINMSHLVIMIYCQCKKTML